MADNYKQIFTRLFQRYNPEKVGEVDELLKKFAGREREMMYKIVMKYGPPVTRVEQKKKLDLLLREQGILTEENSPTTASGTRTYKRLNLRKVAILLIATALVGGLAYAGWRMAQGDWNFFPATATTEEVVLPTQFVLANAVYARNQCQGGEKTDDFLRYGESLSDYTLSGECLVHTNDSAGTSSYFPAQYFVTEERFREIDAIFGNDAGRSQIKHSYEKRALRVWFRHHGIIGKLSPEWKDSIAGKDRNPEVWQIFAEKEPTGLNTWARGNFSKKFGEFSEGQDDLVCIIQSPEDPDKRQLLFFSFDESGQSEIYNAFDLDSYKGRLIRDYPRENDDQSRFIRKASDFIFHKGVLLEDPEGEMRDYLLVWKGDRFSVLEEIPRDTFRIPGLPPIIM
jgi:hypothetical protein